MTDRSGLALAPMAINGRLSRVTSLGHQTSFVVSENGHCVDMRAWQKDAPYGGTGASGNPCS